MAQSQGQAFGNDVGGGIGTQLNPRSSYVGKAILAALVGVAVTVGVAVGGLSVLDGVSETGRLLVQAVAGVAAVAQVLTVGTLAYVTVFDLRDLSRKAAVVAEGDRDADLTSTREDEIGRLYFELARVRDSLDTRASDLQSLNRQITDVVRSQCSVMGECEDGDLTRRMDSETGVGQLDQLAEDFNGMVRRTEGAIAESQRFGSAVVDAAGDVDDNVDEVRDGIETVIDATESINAGVSKQDRRFAETASEMSNLSATIEEVASSATELTEQSRETVRRTEQGRKAAEEADRALDTIRDQADEAVASVGELEGEMDQIGDVVELIREIADETNLLAVNAQIEAAHAGEVGSGFGLVADRIKGLAEETNQAADEIETSLSDLEAQTGTTTERIEETRQTVARGSETIEEALGAFDDIATAVGETNASVQGINDATRQQATTAEDVVRMIDEVASISAETADQADDVVETARRQEEAVTEVDRSIGTLAARARDLTDALSRFEVDSNPGTFRADAGDD
jgi:methyl-accepting chemotaxis protein